MSEASGTGANASRGITTDPVRVAARKRSQRRLTDANIGLENLTLTVDAMWSLLAERLQLTNEDLAVRIDELDKAGSVGGGDRAPETVVCQSCGTAVPNSRPNCQFCGVPNPVA